MRRVKHSICDHAKNLAELNRMLHVYDLDSNFGGIVIYFTNSTFVLTDILVVVTIIFH